MPKAKSSQSRLFFSIIIPTLNEESYLANLLSCLRKQTFKNFEVIVVDGASDDKTQDIITKWQKKIKNLQLLVSKKRNVSWQRNLGAKKAKGKYLLFLDADSLLPAGFLYKQKNNLLKKPVDFFSNLMKTDHPNLALQFGFMVFNVVGKLTQHTAIATASGSCLGAKPEPFHALGGFDQTIVYAEDSQLIRDANRKKYSFSLFSQPKFYWSVRRIQREGFLTYIIKMLPAFSRLFILAQPIQEKDFNYKMGGHLKD